MSPLRGDMNVLNSFTYDQQQIKYIAKNYSPLQYKPQLKELLSGLVPSEHYTDFAKFELHQLINKIIFDNYPGEQVIKYLLFKQYEEKDLIAAFEINVNKSRVDFLTINGVSTSFEIKSDLDNLQKLNKQSHDYLLAFEYNNIVIHDRHLENAEKIIPQSFGIWTFHNGKRKIHRKASLNTDIDAEVQLQLLSKKEFNKFFGSNKKLADVIAEGNFEYINKQFKNALKSRYKTRWDFIKANSKIILPVDLQFFFNMNISPNFIYQ